MKKNAEFGTSALASTVIGIISLNAGLSNTIDHNYRLLYQVANISPRLNEQLRQEPSKVLRGNISANNGEETLSVQAG